MLEEKIKQLESMITDTKVQPSVNAVALDAAVKDEIPRDETSHHMRFKLPTFDGKSSWSIYLRQFEAIAAGTHWTEQEIAICITREESATFPPENEVYCPTRSGGQ
ncbi:uncharacterized protein LOC126879642 [Diabrotica virgifera virgifera]|uniref:Uncharacterized protein n=1 Tax=Diabrotica virgifera virgifera TaxID=50390 RepID=A0ABM5JLG6_DIAVI|nr:uncharacterized protein LOC126879642 [Diabrotica virgifera virgifera]